jgi:riboflavin kinase/FMN adenylyltransferase
VVPGQQLGRKLGIPTANLVIPAGVVIPKFGVYVCRAVIGEKSYPAVANVGTRPTVDGSGITVEPWILDFRADLYGQEITLEFYRFLREETKFPDLSALQKQIHQDAAETRRYFESK